MFLSREELQDLTGYKLQSAIIRWLRREGYGFHVGADGWPRVLKEALIARMRGGHAPKKEPKLRLR